MLLVFTVAALVWANSPWAESYDRFWHTYLTFAFGAGEFTISLGHFVNDGLMAIFFFVIGLEIKREILVGELSSLRQAAVPIVAAVGGGVVPALVYVGIIAMRGGHGYEGWAVPMATDIAFALGILAMLGPRVPLSLKIFLTALAIVDDLGAVLVIAMFYTSEIALGPLGIAGGLLVLAAVANLAGIRTPLVYALIGLIMWLMLLQSGVHATIGGVLLALTIPSKMRIRGSAFSDFARDMVRDFEEAGGDDDDILTNPQRQSAVYALQQACEHVQTPLNRLEHGMHTEPAGGDPHPPALVDAMAKKKEEQEAGAPLWMVTMGDMNTLLMTFFVVLFSMMTQDQVLYLDLKEFFQEMSRSANPREPGPTPKQPDISPIPIGEDPGMEAEVSARHGEPQPEGEDFNVSRREGGVVVNLSGDRGYGVGEYHLSEEQKRRLDALKKARLGHVQAIFVRGFAGSDPLDSWVVEESSERTVIRPAQAGDEDGDHFLLSSLRAQEVRNYLVAGRDGIPERQVQVAEFGTYQKVVDPENREANRRVEIFISSRVRPGR